MILSNEKKYNVSQTIKELQPELRAVVWYDGNGVGTIKPDSGQAISFTEAQLDAAGEIILESILRIAHVSSAKEESTRRIHERYSMQQQNDIIREAIVTQDLTDINAMNTIINGIRASSNTLEDLVAGYDLAQLQPLNFSDDKHWP